MGTTLGAYFVNIHELNILFQLNHFIYSAVFLSWFYFGMVSLSSVYARILLQLINNLRAQYCDDWKWQLNPIYMAWVLKYYYILGNPTRLLSIVLILCIVTLATTTFILCKTKSYELFFICVFAIYATKFGII